MSLPSDQRRLSAIALQLLVNTCAGHTASLPHSSPLLENAALLPGTVPPLLQKHGRMWSCHVLFLSAQWLQMARVGPLLPPPQWLVRDRPVRLPCELFIWTRKASFNLLPGKAGRYKPGKPAETLFCQLAVTLTRGFAQPKI